MCVPLVLLRKIVDCTTIQVGFHMQAAKTPARPVMYSFPLFVALYNHSPPTLCTDGQTDVIPSALSAKSYVLYFSMLH